MRQAETDNKNRWNLGEGVIVMGWISLERFWTREAI